MPTRAVPPHVRELLRLGALPALRAIPTPLMLVDLGVVARRLAQLRALLPKARVFYGVGAQPLRPLIAELGAEGVGFNVTTRAEMDLVLNQGVGPDRILLHHPVKSREEIAYAYSRGVRQFVADTADEVGKLAELAPGSGVIARLWIDPVRKVRATRTRRSASVPPPPAAVPGRFGASESEAVVLLEEAQRRGLEPLGVTFHVGALGAAEGPGAWARGAAIGARVIGEIVGRGIRPVALSVGGGFPVDALDPATDKDAKEAIVPIAEAIAEATRDLPAEVALLVEPGRWLVADSAVLAATVVGTAERPNGRWAFVDVGVFHGLLDAARGVRFPVHVPERTGTPIPWHLSGATLAAADVLGNGVSLPDSLREGDRLYFAVAGAYATPHAADLEAIRRPSWLVVATDKVRVSTRPDGSLALVARRPCHAAERVVVCTSASEARRRALFTPMAMSTLEFDPPANFARHADKPTCVLATPGMGPPALLALRPLKEGDEITWDRGRGKTAG